MVVGLIFIIFLRMIGLFQTIPFTSLNRLVPIIWAGVVLQVFSGFTLWSSKPAKYLSDGMFLWKFSLVILGVIVTVYFHKTLKREAASWRETGTVSSWGKQIVAATALVWAAVFGFEVPKRECHENLRKFKSTTLARNAAKGVLRRSCG